MQALIDTFLNGFFGTLNYTFKSITGQVPWYKNYFWGLILISLLVWSAEVIWPWRKSQKTIRQDFWVDFGYMFFNFFLFAIVIQGFYNVFSLLVNLEGFSIQSLALINLSVLPIAVQLVLFFVVLDFVQWVTHIALHKFAFLWRFHQIHHSVKQMGFAAHLRYHWMENILYKPLKTLAVILLGGFEPEQAFVVHFMAITIGHLNHANIKLTYGPFKYLFNNPVMHLYHHAKYIPQERFGVNFGISLSIWDYMFNTHYLPKVNGNIALGFIGDTQVPTSFWQQLSHGFKLKKL